MTPRHKQIFYCKCLLKRSVFLFKRKIAMIDEAKAIVKRTMCNQNPLCCNVWSLLGHLIYWLNLFSLDYLHGKWMNIFWPTNIKHMKTFLPKRLASEWEPIRTGLIITSTSLRRKSKTKQTEESSLECKLSSECAQAHQSSDGRMLSISGAFCPSEKSSFNSFIFSKRNCGSDWLRGLAPTLCQNVQTAAK